MVATSGFLALGDSIFPFDDALEVVVVQLVMQQLRKHSTDLRNAEVR